MIRCEICDEEARVEVVLKEDEEHMRFMCLRCQPTDKFLAQPPHRLNDVERFGMTGSDI